MEKSYEGGPGREVCLGAREAGGRRAMPGRQEPGFPARVNKR